jgi:hypothetical protein
LLYVYSDRVDAVREGTMLDELLDYYPGRTDREKVAGERAELERNPPKLIVYGDDPAGYGRKTRYISALVDPFIRDFGYKRIEPGYDIFLRP